MCVLLQHACPVALHCPSVQPSGQSACHASAYAKSERSVREVREKKEVGASREVREKREVRERPCRSRLATYRLAANRHRTPVTSRQLDGGRPRPWLLRRDR